MFRDTVVQRSNQGATIKPLPDFWQMFADRHSRNLGRNCLEITPKMVRGIWFHIPHINRRWGAIEPQQYHALSRRRHFRRVFRVIRFEDMRQGQPEKTGRANTEYAAAILKAHNVLLSLLVQSNKLASID